MKPRPIIASVAVALCFLLHTSSAQAQTKKPIGTWTKPGDISVSFTFEADTLICKLDLMGTVLTVHADYGMSKDGVIFGRINKVDKQGTDAGPSEGDLFTFHIAVKDNILTITNLGPDSNADARPLVEGEYKAEKKK
jgi:hypothetical protein